MSHVQVGRHLFVDIGHRSEQVSSSNGMDSDSPRNSNSSDSGRRVTSILSRREPSSSLYLLPPSPNPSTATSTPFASRSTSPLPAFYPLHSSSCPSDTDSETSTYHHSPKQSFRSWKENKRPWWAVSTRRRKRHQGFRISRWLRRLQRRVLLHFFFNQESAVASVSLLYISYLSPTSPGFHSYPIFSISRRGYPLYNVRS